MATKTLGQMVDYISRIKSESKKAQGMALMKVMLDAEKNAKIKVKQNFIGRGGRRLSGRLLNSLFVEFDVTKQDTVGYLGTRGIPYGRAHEFGIKKHPVNRKRRWLWIKTEYAWQSSKFKRLTPSEFYERQKKDFRYFYVNGAAMYGEATDSNPTPLFWLRKFVKIPERPYIRPAIRRAIPYYGTYFYRILSELAGGGNE